MIRDLYIPSDIGTEDHYPNTPVDDKLKIINGATPTLRSFSVIDCVALPFGPTIGFTVRKSSSSTAPYLYVEELNLRDPVLFGQGIGSRLIKAATRWGLEVEPDLRVLHTNAIRWGAVNAFVKVFGVVNVATENDGVRYGMGSDKPFSEILDDEPPVPGRPYILPEGISVKIDHETARSWELPVREPHQMLVSR